MLLLGDPGTAKSQLLKFVEKVSPIGVRYMYLKWFTPSHSGIINVFNTL